jgi:hypothetical protein
MMTTRWNPTEARMHPYEAARHIQKLEEAATQLIAALDALPSDHLNLRGTDEWHRVRETKAVLERLLEERSL